MWSKYWTSKPTRLVRRQKQEQEQSPETDSDEQPSSSNSKEPICKDEIENQIPEILYRANFDSLTPGQTPLELGFSATDMTSKIPQNNHEMGEALFWHFAVERAYLTNAKSPYGRDQNTTFVSTWSDKQKAEEAIMKMDLGVEDKGTWKIYEISRKVLEEEDVVVISAEKTYQTLLGVGVLTEKRMSKGETESVFLVGRHVPKSAIIGSSSVQTTELGS
ncbi:uncharacterized protein BP5553_06301 [Venustampulla echinocandica]|uniref:Uncharacterized protein n=1 Tax=Venustampulla echinocandica TaxID=2656787 RepID=A0A370TJK2_9HELO|nr:uncharacterized protein BP5553_06301 [Venustampulla echinocandica]RDL35689.1 hypothetical protein BP5553_06301 [Venustampulla echinocandica]